MQLELKSKNDWKFGDAYKMRSFLAMHILADYTLLASAYYQCLQQYDINATPGLFSVHHARNPDELPAFKPIKWWGITDGLANKLIDLHRAYDCFTLLGLTNGLWLMGIEEENLPDNEALVSIGLTCEGIEK